VVCLLWNLVWYLSQEILKPPEKEFILTRLSLKRLARSSVCILNTEVVEQPLSELAFMYIIILLEIKALGSSGNCFWLTTYSRNDKYTLPLFNKDKMGSIKWNSQVKNAMVCAVWANHAATQMQNLFDDVLIKLAIHLFSYHDSCELLMICNLLERRSSIQYVWCILHLYLPD